MNDIAIEVRGLGKQYHIGNLETQSDTLTATILSSIKAPARRVRDLLRGNASGANDLTREFWAVQDVSFDVHHGEVVGVIGRNGAGKSTLLKMLSRITTPTTGYAKVAGRVGSLLEVGTGFHPELTGRENVYLNGSILGMRRTEIERKFDDIVDFAGVAQFIDTPVKHYSSGMRVRLGFAVAAFLEPEILVIDEVLSVGDADFQRRSLGKMGEVSRSGRTVLFVSHNMAAVENLCTRGIVLEQGQMRFDGTANDAVQDYLRRRHAPVPLRDIVERKGSGEVRLVGFEMLDVHGTVIDVVPSGADVTMRLHYEAQADYDPHRLISSIVVRTVMGTPVFQHHNILTGDDFGAMPQRGIFEVALKGLALVPTTYVISMSIMTQSRDFLDGVEDAVELSVVGSDFYKTGQMPAPTHGLFVVDGAWRVIAVEGEMV